MCSHVSLLPYRERWVQSVCAARRAFFWQCVNSKRECGNPSSNRSFSQFFTSNLLLHVKPTALLIPFKKPAFCKLVTDLECGNVSLLKCAETALMTLLAANSPSSYQDLFASGILEILATKLTLLPNASEVDTVILTLFKHSFIAKHRPNQLDWKMALMSISRCLQQRGSWFSLGYQQRALVLTVLINVASLSKEARTITLQLVPVVHAAIRNNNANQLLSAQEHLFACLWLQNLVIGTNESKDQCLEFVLDLTKRYDLDTTHACQIIFKSDPLLLYKVADHWLTYLAISSNNTDALIVSLPFMYNVITFLFAHMDPTHGPISIQLLLATCSLNFALPDCELAKQNTWLQKVLRSCPKWVLDTLFQELQPSRKHCLFFDFDVLRVAIFKSLVHSEDLLMHVSHLLSKCALYNPHTCLQKMLNPKTMQCLEEATTRSTHSAELFDNLFYFWHNIFQMFDMSNVVVFFFVPALYIYHRDPKWNAHAMTVLLQVTKRTPDLLPLLQNKLHAN